MLFANTFFRRFSGLITGGLRRQMLRIFRNAAAKVQISEQNTKENRIFFVFSSESTFERSSKVRII